MTDQEKYDFTVWLMLFFAVAFIWGIWSIVAEQGGQGNDLESAENDYYYDDQNDIYAP